MKLKIFFLQIISLLATVSLHAVSLPAGVTADDYMLTGQDYDNGDVLYDVKIAFDGNTAYLGNFAFNAKGAWIQGTKEGDNITFPEEQLVQTLDDGTEIWFYGVSITSTGIESKDLVLTYDAKADEYLANAGIMLTMGKPTATSLPYLEIFDNILISKTGRRIIPHVEFSKTIISQQPTGTLKTYSRSGTAYMNFMNKASFTLQDGMALNIVFASDNKTVYMQSPISYAGTNSWVKGIIRNNVIHMPLYQSIIRDGNNYGIIGVCRWNKSHTYLEPYLRATEITFTVNPETGVITQDGDDAYALLWSEDMSWSLYADMNSVYTPLTDSYVKIPKGLQTEQLAMTYKFNDEMNPVMKDVNLVLTGALDTENGKYYIAGLSTFDPDAAIVGNVEGNNIVFPSNQFLGTGTKQMAYFTAVSYYIEEMKMEFDPTNVMTFYITKPELLNTLTLTRNADGDLVAPDNVGIMLTKGMANNETLSQTYFQAYLSPVIKLYNEHPATPATPEIRRYRNDMEMGGYDCINLYIEPKDTKGEFINPQRLSYQLYVQVDGKVEPYVFRTDEYRIATDMTEVPFIFSCRDLANSTDIAVGGTEIYLYQTGFENIGAQTINYSGGEEHRSEITWWKDPSTIEPPVTPERPAAPQDPGDNPDDQSIAWGEYNGSQNLGSWGTQKSETYYLAMKVNDPTIVGSKITSVKVPLNSTSVTDCHLWFVRGALSGNCGQGTEDAVNIAFTPAGTWTEVTLPEPFVVGEGEFYVGITYTTNGNTPLPQLLMASEHTGNSFVKSSRTYRRWADLGNVIKAALPLQLTVRGNIIKPNSVSIKTIDNVFMKHGNTANTKVTIANNGNNAVTDIDWTYNIADKTTNGHNDIDITADYYGAIADFTLTVPAVDENGLYQGTLTITKVNGVANNSNVSTGTHEVKVMNVVPKKRPLAEEFTGTWCGFCPSGYVAMKLMNERHPDDFVCASYHNKDAMTITDNYPVEVSAFPTFVFDRNHYTDAYKGDTSKDMGIEETWLKECLEMSPVNVEVQAELNNETGIINVDAQYEFCEDVEGADYGVAYIVTADGLHGNDRNWRQHNYYSKEYSNGSSSGMYKEGMDMFNNGPEYMFLEYDDVAIGTSAESGKTISGVINSNCKEAEVFTHEYTFKLADLNSNYGNKENLVQDNTRLHVIALVYDNKSKQVLNCNKCNVTLTSGIEEVNVIDNDNDNIYNLQGIRVTKAYKGIVVTKGKKSVVWRE